MNKTRSKYGQDQFTSAVHQLNLRLLKKIYPVIL